MKKKKQEKKTKQIGKHHLLHNKTENEQKIWKKEKQRKKNGKKWMRRESERKAKRIKIVKVS